MNIDELIRALRCCGLNSSTVYCRKECVFFSGNNMEKCIPVMTANVIEALEEAKQAIKERDQIERDFKKFTEDHWSEDTRFPCHYCREKLRDGKCLYKINHPNNREGCFGKHFKWRGMKGAARND